MKRFYVLLAGAAMFSLAIGCGGKDDAKTGETKSSSTSSSSSESSDAHAHGNGPHGGALADWGGGAYHVEFTVDHDKKEATVYLIGSDEKSPAPIKAESIQLTIDDPATEMELTAMPLEGEEEGMSSRFVGTHDTIGIVQEFAGTISGEVDGTPYTGDFKEEPAEE